MKILKIFFVVTAVLIPALIIAAVIFVMTFDINRYKTQIVNKASAALGRKVDFKSAKLDLSIKQGLSVKVRDLGVADDPAFAQQDFLTVKEASFAIDILGLIFRKKVNVSGIFVDAPSITLIRGKDGNFNIAGLAEAGKKDVGVTTDKAATIAVPVVLPALLISSVKVSNGAVVYIDRMATPALSLEISKVGLEANKVSLNAAFPFVAQAAVLGDEQNIRMEAKVSLDLKNNAVTVSGLKAEVQLDRIMPEKILLYFPMAKDMTLPTNLGGRAQFLFDDFTVNGKGLSHFSAAVSIENGYLQFKELASPVQDLVLDAKVTQKDVSLEHLFANLGQGRIEGSGKLEDYLFAQKYNLQVGVKNLSPEDLVVQDKSSVKLEGVIASQIGVNGSGFAPEAIKTNLSGQAQVDVARPRLRNINILRTVLDKITVIPGLSETIKASLPELFRQKLTQKDTIFSDVNLPATITNGKVALKEITLKADEFIFEGWGESGLDGSFFMEGAFMIPAQLSQAMVAAVNELTYLLNDDKQIYIPLKVSGNAGRQEFNVDVAYVINKLLAGQGKKQLLRVLDKALGTQEESGQAGQEASPQKPDSQKQEPEPEDTLKGVLKEIL